MDRLNKFYIDSSWRKKKDVNDSVKIIKQVAKEQNLKSTIKIKDDGIWHTIHVKLNRNK